MKEYLKVKNWDDHQHYKDREPTWIKVKRELLNNYDFSKLPDITKGHLMLIWVLASQVENKIPNDAGWIAQKIGASDEINLKLLISKGYLILYQNDTEVAPTPYQNASPENIEKRHIEKRQIDIQRAREDFETLWKIFPDGRPKGNKQTAFKKYQTALKETKHENIIRGCERYGAFCQAGNFNQHLSTWLNQRGWDEAWEAGSNKPAGRSHQNEKPSYSDQMRNAAGNALKQVLMDATDSHERGEGMGNENPRRISAGPASEPAGNQAVSLWREASHAPGHAAAGRTNPAKPGTLDVSRKAGPPGNHHGAPPQAVHAPAPEGRRDAKGLSAERLHKADSGSEGDGADDF